MKAPLAAIIVSALLVSLSIGFQSVQATETDFPIVTAMCRLSYFNDSGGSKILVLDVSTWTLAAANIQHSISYSIDGQNTVSIPFELRQNKSMITFQAIISGEATLPILPNGSHNITVYARSTVSSGNFPPEWPLSASETLCFTLEGQPTISIVTPSPSPAIVPNPTPTLTTPPTPSPSPTPSLSPSPSASHSPTRSPSLNPLSIPTPSPAPIETPTLSATPYPTPQASPSENPKSALDSNQNQPLPQAVIYGAALAGSVVFILAAAFVVRKRQHSKLS